MEDTGKIIALIKALGGSGALPEITDADDGKVLTANSGVWGAQNPIGEPFIVTLTPTAADYSGTMDKTVAEIDAAYKAGREIVFSLSNGNETFEIPMAYRCANDVSAYYTVYIINTLSNIMIIAYTSYVQGSASYSTKVYTLTPAT